METRTIKFRVMRWLANKIMYYQRRETMDERIQALRDRGVTIGEGVTIWDGIIDPVFPNLITIGHNCTLTDATIVAHDDSLILHLGYTRVAPVTIGDSVFIGRGAIVLAGVAIGSRSIVGAKSVVTRDVPEGSVVAGNPARVIATIDEFLERAKADPMVLDEVPITNRFAGDQVISALRAAAERRRSLLRSVETRQGDSPADGP